MPSASQGMRPWGVDARAAAAAPRAAQARRRWRWSGGRRQRQRGACCACCAPSLSRVASRYRRPCRCVRAGACPAPCTQGPPPPRARCPPTVAPSAAVPHSPPRRRRPRRPAPAPAPGDHYAVGVRPLCLRLLLLHACWHPWRPRLRHLSRERGRQGEHPPLAWRALRSRRDAVAGAATRLHTCGRAGWVAELRPAAAAGVALRPLRAGLLWWRGDHP